jgi:hypothetical protein
VTPLKFSGGIQTQPNVLVKNLFIYKVEWHQFEGNAGFFFVGNAWNDDRIRDSFEISCVSLPRLKYNG